MITTIIAADFFFNFYAAMNFVVFLYLPELLEIFRDFLACWILWPYVDKSTQEISPYKTPWPSRKRNYTSLKFMPTSSASNEGSSSIRKWTLGRPRILLLTMLFAATKSAHVVERFTGRKKQVSTSVNRKLTSIFQNRPLRFLGERLRKLSACIACSLSWRR